MRDHRAPPRRWRLNLCLSLTGILLISGGSILFSRDSRVKSMAWLRPSLCCRTALVGLYAALMFLLALCSKFNLAKHSAAARAEVERRRRG